MEKEFGLNTEKLFIVGDALSKALLQYGVKIDNVLTITIPREYFKKVDEDLFYRMNPDEKERGDFIPSVGKIELDFENLKIYLKEEEKSIS